MIRTRVVQRVERRPDHTRYNDRIGDGAIHSSSCIQYSHTMSKRLRVQYPGPSGIKDLTNRFANDPSTPA